MTINDNGVLHTEEYDAFIGIVINDKKVILYVHEKGNLPDSFWLNLPDSMKATIKNALEGRKESLLKVKGDK
jgi:hypothetical protein